MRIAILAVAASLSAVPAAAGAQDHSAHRHHAPLDEPEAEEEERTDEGEDLPKTDHAQMDHAQMDHAARGHGVAPASPPASGPPPRALEGPLHAADSIYGSAAMAAAREELARHHGQFTGGTVMLERLEARISDGEDHYLWDAQAWYGGDIDKLWLKSEGEGAWGGEVESAELQALWSHAIGPWFDLQTGVRYDIEPQGRAHAVLGVQGLAPYMFEVDAATFLSESGDLTAQVEAEYDQRITQRLILQPRAELSLAAQDVREHGIGAGLTSIETGLRLRYEIVREFAPYVGIAYAAKLGETGDLARAAGGDPDSFSMLFGIRAWF